MLKAVIVDDEYIVIEGLKRMIDWPAFGVEIVATAGDGPEALEAVREHRPDLIMTDIRMPGMDGLRLLEEIKSFLPDAYTIVFSGYNEFEYVKRAIQLGANDYLEKPVTVPNAMQALQKAVDHLQRQREIRRKAREGLRVDLQVMTLELLKGKFRDYDRWAEAARNMADGLAAVTVLACAERLPLEDRDECAFLFIPKDDAFLYVVLHRVHPEQPQLWEYVEAAGDIPVGAGRTYERPEQLPDSFREAKKALRCAQYLNHNGLVRYEDLGDLFTASGDISEHEEDIILSLRAGNYAGLMENVDRFVEWIRQQPLDPELVERELVKLLYLALSVSNEIARVSGEDRALPHLQMMELKEKDAMLAWFREQFDGIARSMMEIRENAKFTTIEKAKRYIDEHMAEDVSLQALARHLGMNPSSLSVLFKEVTGMTYIKYLTRLRIEKAKQLLAEGRKVGEVSGLVGYYTYRHFTDVFKQQTGMTPGQYRDKVAQAPSPRGMETEGGQPAG